ncbi:MAG: hypothetical protein ACE5J7_01805 [Candidatus Aenigmatarchaeota archaeon]
MQFDNTGEGTYRPVHLEEFHPALSEEQYNQALSLNLNPDAPDFDYEGFIEELNKY